MRFSEAMPVDRCFGLVDVMPSSYDLIIFDLASYLLSERQIEASFFAAQRTIEMRRHGDPIGERIWTDVLRAIEAMSNDAPSTIQ